MSELDKNEQTAGIPSSDNPDTASTDMISEFVEETIDNIEKDIFSEDSKK